MDDYINANQGDFSNSVTNQLSELVKRNMFLQEILQEIDEEKKSYFEKINILKDNFLSSSSAQLKKIYLAEAEKVYAEFEQKLNQLVDKAHQMRI